MSETHSATKWPAPQTVAFTVLAQLCVPKANETEMEAGEEKRVLHGKENGRETHSATKWPAPQTVAFTVLAQLCVPKANETEMEAGKENRLLYGKENGSETHSATKWPAPQTVAFTVLAQLCGPKANEMEMGAAIFTNIVRERLRLLRPSGGYVLELSGLLSPLGQCHVPEFDSGSRTYQLSFTPFPRFTAYFMNSISHIIIHPKNMQFMERLAFFLLS